jgi:hypothetical protein
MYWLLFLSTNINLMEVAVSRLQLALNVSNLPEAQYFGSLRGTPIETSPDHPVLWRRFLLDNVRPIRDDMEKRLAPLLDEVLTPTN